MPVPVQGVCRNCMAWTPVELKGPVTIGQVQRGVCRGAPATPVPVTDRHGNVAGQRDMRPCPAGDDWCLLFTPRVDLISGDPAAH